MTLDTVKSVGYSRGVTAMAPSIVPPFEVIVIRPVRRRSGARSAVSIRTVMISLSSVVVPLVGTTLTQGESVYMVQFSSPPPQLLSSNAQPAVVPTTISPKSWLGGWGIVQASGGTGATMLTVAPVHSTGMFAP